MNRKILRKPILLLALSICWSYSNPIPVLAAPTTTQLVEAITNAKVLPASITMNARYSMGEVSLYMYRSGRVPDNDLKIDSVLITKALRDKFGQDIKQVQLNFYDKENKATIRQCTVNQTHINSFSTKQITQQQLLDMLTIARMSAGGTGGAGGSSSFNASAQVVLNATCVEGFEKRKREQTLSKIKDLAEKGGNFQAIFGKFKRMEGLISAGQLETVGPLYNDIETEIAVEERRLQERHRSDLQASEARRVQALAGTQVLNYEPRFGFALWRRRAIWAAIRRLHERGDDVSSYMITLKDTVDKPLGDGNNEAVKAGIIRLEQQLGIPSGVNW